MKHRPSDPAKVERLRRICMALPGTTEKLSHGEAAWFAGPRQFANTADHHHDERLSVWCAAAPMTQEMLVKADPVRFFRPPYVGHRGWVGVYLDVANLDWEELASILTNAYRQVAPKRLLARLDPQPS